MFSFIQAKFPNSAGLTVDLQGINIKGKNEKLILMTDNKALRQREKAQASKEC